MGTVKKVNQITIKIYHQPFSKLTELNLNGDYIRTAVRICTY